MKISRSQMFRNFNKWCLSAVVVLFIGGAFSSFAQEGGDLFKAKCSSCHLVFGDMTGPQLNGARARWADNGAGDDVLIQWVKDFNVAAVQNGFAKTVVDLKPTNMQVFGDEMTDEQILSIFDWVDSQEPKAAGPALAAGDGAAGVEEEESSMGWIWIVIAILFVIIILSVGGVRRQLKSAESESAGGDFTGSMSYTDELKQWAWINKKYVGVGVLVVVLALVVTLFQSLYTINIMENYQPSQPIEFPHSIHAGTNKIDCKYCHNSATKSKTAGLPTVNVCMNCHKQITGSGDQMAKIQKIYDAAGWDKDAGTYSKEKNPIVWNKVHVLPDHVYFSHKQHVVVGGVDCKQCHGDMAAMSETAKVQPVSELNKIDGNVQLTKSTLTMGWCIECHQETGISEGPLYKDEKDGGSGYYNEIHRRLMSGDKKLYSEYLEDNKVSVKELGGWECAKCHY